MPFSPATWQVAPSSFSGNLTGRYPYPRARIPLPLRAQLCFACCFSGPPRFADERVPSESRRKPSATYLFVAIVVPCNILFVARESGNTTNTAKGLATRRQPSLILASIVRATPHERARPSPFPRPENQPVSHSKPKEAAMAYRNFSKEFIERYEEDRAEGRTNPLSHKRGAGPSPQSPPRYVAPATPSRLRARY